MEGHVEQMSVEEAFAALGEGPTGESEASGMTAEEAALLAGADERGA